jgi:hypothetical protein
MKALWIAERIAILRTDIRASSGHAALDSVSYESLCARARASSSSTEISSVLRGEDAISVRRVEFRLVTSQGAAGLQCVAGGRGVRKEKRRECQGVTTLRQARKNDLNTHPSLQATESRQTLRELRGFRADSKRVSISLVTRCKSSFFGRSRGISSTVSFEYTQRKSRHHHNILSPHHHRPTPLLDPDGPTRTIVSTHQHQPQHPTTFST